MGRVPAAEHTLAILGFLARQPAPVPAAMISRALGLPRSTTYHLLTTLMDSHFVTHYPEDRLYGLGFSAYELGTGYTRQEPLQRLARKLLDDLSDDLHNSVHLSVLHGREMLYVLEVRAPGRPRLITDAGVRLPAQVTASGRSVLAALDPSHVRALYPDSSAFGNSRDLGPRSLSALRRLLSDVRTRGYATEEGEVTSGLSSVAMPVRDHSGHPVASVAVTFPQEDASPAYVDTVAAAVRRTVEELGRRLGAGLSR